MPESRCTVDLIIDAEWIAPVTPPVILHNHSLVVDGSRILDLLPTGEARARYVATDHQTLHRQLLIPGLINLHTHAAMTLLRGIADDRPLMTWLQEFIWPAENALMSHGFVLDGTRLACAEMLRGGITCFNDMYFYPDATAIAATEFGMRALVGITTLEFPTPYAADADDYLTRGLATRSTWLNHPLIRFCLAPHAPYTVSDRTFERVLTLSEQLNLPIHCHIHETRDEITQSLQQHTQRPLARLDHRGLIGPNFIGVHAVHLEPDEISLLAERGAHVAHCPTSNLKLASGFSPISSLMAAGVNVGLGTDGAASNNRLDLFAEMRLASLLAKGLSHDAAALKAMDTLTMATLNGAKALGVADEIGSLAIGKQADIVSVDLSSLMQQPVFDPVSHLIHVCDRHDVCHVWVAGKCCVRDKVVVHSSENPLEAAIALWQNRAEVQLPAKFATAA